MDKFSNSAENAGGDGAGSKQETGQATLSAIRDVSIAATDAIAEVVPPTQTQWLSILGFLLLTYILSSLVAIYCHRSAPWVQVLVTPLVPALIASAAFWRRQAWKFRSHDWRFKEKVVEHALNALAHETANALNAMYANLTAIRGSNPQPSAAQHLEQLDLAMKRIDAALAKAISRSIKEEEADAIREVSQVA